MAVGDKLRAVQIKANLIADDKVGLMEIEAEVHDGIATLTGEVATDEQKQAAEALAYEVDGVYEVHNDLQIIGGKAREQMCKLPDAHFGYGLAEGDFGDTAFALSDKYEAPGPGVPTSEQFPGQFTDEDLIQEVQDKLKSQDRMDVSAVTASVHNQIVYLKGTVSNPEELNELQDAILSVRGIMGVCTEITTKQGDVGTPTD